MKSRRMICLCCLAAMTIAASTALADGWKMPSLNPFKKASSGSDRAKASISDKSKSSGLPKLSLPSWGSESSKPKGPSTMQKINSGTKSFFSKTKDVLMPWNTSSKKTSSSRSSKPKKKSILTSWIPTKKPPKKERMTVSDFIGQDRPDF